MFRIDAKVDVEVHIHPAAEGSQVLSMLAEIKAAISKLEQTMTDGVNEVNARIDALVTDVENQTTVIQSCETAFNGLAAEIADLKNQIAQGGVTDLTQVTAKLDALETSLRANTSRLATAVPQNTE